MKSIIIYLIMGLTIVSAQDAAGQYKLTGVDVLYTWVSRSETVLTVTDAYGLNITQAIATIPAAAPFTTQPMQLTDAALSAVGINLNITLNADGSGSVADGSYYPDVNTITDENGICVTLQQVLPVTDDFTYTSDGNMGLDLGITTIGFNLNVLGNPGISTESGLGGFGLSNSNTFEDFPMIPEHPTIEGPDGSSFPFTVGDYDEDGTVQIYPEVNALGFSEYIPGGAPLTGFFGGLFKKVGVNADVLESVLEGNTTPDFYLEWHGIDGSSSGLGCGSEDDCMDDELIDEDEDGTYFDRQVGIPAVTATYLHPACGYNLPVFGDVSEVFPAECVDYVGDAASGYLMDPSGSLVGWGNFLTAHAALFSQCLEGAISQGMDENSAQTHCGTTYPEWLADDSASDIDPTCLLDGDPSDCSGRLTMDFDVPCVGIIEAREVITEFVEVSGEIVGCMASDACNYNEAATIGGTCIYGVNNSQMPDVEYDLCFTAGTCDYDDCGLLSTKENVLVDSYSLDSIYPNPFNPVTSIVFILPVADIVSIKVFDITGRELLTLKDDYTLAGSHTINWDASSHPSGVYLLQMTSGSFSKTQKIVLMK